MWNKNLGRRLRNPLQVSSRTLSGGERGNIQTVRFMIREARKNSRNPFIRQKALNILANAGIPSHDDLSEALAIGAWVQRNVRYVKDPADVELLTNPLTLLDQISIGQGMGDCDDMSLLIATLLLSIGHNPYFRAVRYNRDKGYYDHIYVVDYLIDLSRIKRRIVLDAIFKDQPIGYETSHQSGTEFKV